MNIKKYSVYLWALVALSFMAFIGLMSYWYPITFDEYFLWDSPFNFTRLKTAYFKMIPRISIILGLPVFALGKWSFILLNTLIQFGNCLCLFYISFLRLPDVKKMQDMPYFLMILCMSIFFVSRPSEVLFWVSGAITYSWTLFFFLLALCFLRQIQNQKFILKDNVFVGLFLFIIGFIIATSNEAIAPISLGYIICFGLFCNFKKIKTPKALSFMIFGIAIGCLVFFSAPAHYNRMNLEGWAALSAVPLSKKLFFHIYHLNEFFKTQFILPVITSLFILIAFIDRDKKSNDKTNLLLSLAFLLILSSMVFILFAAPKPPLRAYYQASVMGIISFLFLVRYYIEVYGFDFSKILCYLVIFISLFFAPRFVLPHYALYLQEQTRNYLTAAKRPISEMTPYLVLKGPTKNLSIGFTDFANREFVTEGIYGVNTSELEDW